MNYRNPLIVIFLLVELSSILPLADILFDICKTRLCEKLAALKTFKILKMSKKKFENFFHGISKIEIESS